MLMPDRNGGNSYRYGMNGMEQDDEVKGKGNSYTTTFRQYEPRLGRWLSLDPKSSEMAGWSPYSSNFNNPLIYTDTKGDVPIPVIYAAYTVLVGVAAAGVIYTAYQVSQSAGALYTSYHTTHLVAESTGVANAPAIQDISTEAIKELEEQITDALYKHRPKYKPEGDGKPDSKPDFYPLPLNDSKTDTEEETTYTYYRAMSNFEYNLTQGYLVDIRKTGEEPHIRKDKEYLDKAKFISKDKGYDVIIEYTSTLSPMNLQITPYRYTAGEGKGSSVFNGARDAKWWYIKYEGGNDTYGSYGFPGSSTTRFNSSLTEKPEVIEKL